MLNDELICVFRYKVVTPMAQALVASQSGVMPSRMNLSRI